MMRETDSDTKRPRQAIGWSSYLFGVILTVVLSGLWYQGAQLTLIRQDLERLAGTQQSMDQEQDQMKVSLATARANSTWRWSV